MSEHAPTAVKDDAAAAAINHVLRAEAAAHEAIEQAQQQAERMAESARADVRALAARTERRIRAVVTAFERDINARVAEIDAVAATLAEPRPHSTADLDALRRAVRDLARELTEGGP